MSGVCHGCGAQLPPKTWAGRERIWCSERCRKASYGDPCVDCGKRTSLGAEHKRVPEPRCLSCAMKHRRRWTPELVIAAIREWAAESGEVPSINDWNPWYARNVLGDEARARGFEDADGRWPSFSTPVRLFGSWNTAIFAAGFESRQPDGGGGNERRRRSERAKAAA